MKKFGKIILALVLIGAVGFTGFNLGKNMNVSQGMNPKDNEHIANMNMLKDLINQNFLFDYKDEDLYQGSLKGMFESLDDPYTVYYTKDEYTKLMQSINGRYEGIGVLVQASKEGFIKAVAVFDQSPAKKAGIKPGDYITKVEGKEYNASQMEEAVANIKGDPGTSVKLTVLRVSDDNPNGEELEFDVERSNVKVDTIDDEIIGNDDKKIGYIHIKSFDDVTKDDFEESYEKLKAENIKGLILDLRNNPGGSLDVCLKIADKFLDEGVIVTTEDKKGNVITEESDKDFDDIPITVLVNENSASASEILSGALKDRKRAKVIGVQTFGKGIVQKLFPLSDGTGAKITISEYHTPNGEKINGVGVTPDIEVENKEDINEIKKENFTKDDQFKRALSEILKEIEE